MKFNLKAISSKVLNYEGATAYKLTPEMELYTLVVAGKGSIKSFPHGKTRYIAGL